jgi:hypothetical protein
VRLPERLFEEMDLYSSHSKCRITLDKITKNPTIYRVSGKSSKTLLMRSDY